MKLRDAVRDYLKRWGFECREPGENPPGAEWSLDVMTPPPLNVGVKIVYLKSGVMTAVMGVRFSPEHARLVAELKEEERVRFATRMLVELLKLCPSCRIAIQPGIQQPEAVLVEAHFDPDRLERGGLVELLHAVQRLVNAYILVNALLWEKFPPKMGAHRPPMGFM